MAKGAFGRLDYRPKLECWSAILYVGRRDVEVGRYPSQESAREALWTAYQERKLGYRFRK